MALLSKFSIQFSHTFLFSYLPMDGIKSAFPGDLNGNGAFKSRENGMGSLVIDLTNSSDEEPSNIAPKLADQRLQVDDLELKRRRAFENKQLLLKKPKLEDEATRILQERKKLQDDRLNEYINRLPPLKTLPLKYQTPVPDLMNLDESVPPIKAFTTPQEEMEDTNLPVALRSHQFRAHLRLSMNDICHRITQFRVLYIKMNKVLIESKKVLESVEAKKELHKQVKKLLLRYAQISNYLKSNINQLAIKNGEVGAQFDKLMNFKREIFNKFQTFERFRLSAISNPSVILPSYDPNDYVQTSRELSLINDSVNILYKLSNDGNPMKYKLLREMTLPPLPLPPFQRAQMPLFNNPYQMNNVVVLDDEDDEFGNYSNGRVIVPFQGVGAAKNDEFQDLELLMNTLKSNEITQEGLANTPEDLVVNLMKHQRIGLSWLLKMEESHNKGGILADDMGLGKTVQSIALILANKPKDDEVNKNQSKTNLIVGPVSLLNQWQSEFKIKVKKSTQIKTFLFHGSNKVKKFEDFKHFDVVFVSYSTLASEYKKHYAKELFDSGKNISKSMLTSNYKSPFFTNDSSFYRIILDEAQNIKNRLAQASIATSLLKSRFKWCLSGTPIQNNIDELFPLLRFLGIRPYNDYGKFKTSISLPLKNKSPSASRKIHALLTAILLRRTKDSEIDGEPILKLPEKHVIEEFIEMTDFDKLFYQTLEEKSAKTASKLMNSQTKRVYSSILTLLLRMRQACDHEYLVQMGEDGNRGEKLQRYTKGWESLKGYEESIFERIEDERDTGLVCIKCDDQIDDEHCLLLSKCGHVMCKDCHNEHFDDNSLTEWDGIKSAKCLKCEVENLDSMSVDLPLYKCFKDEGLTWQEVRKKFELNSQASDVNWRKKMIDKLISQEENGKLKISGKIIKTLELIEKILLGNNGDEKVIIFSQFIGFFEIIGRLLKEREIGYLQYDGNMNMQQKNDAIKEFYQTSSKRVLLLSLKAGNVGLTLTCANHVIILEPFWNPYVEKQAQDRVHRISQVREVFIHRLLVKNTVEDRIMELQKQKEEMVENALDPNARKQIGQLSRRELGFLFGLNGLATLENE